VDDGKRPWALILRGDDNKRQAVEDDLSAREAYWLAEKIHCADRNLRVQ
jgi:hypothetical protein